jgi:starch phosphorylase
MEASGTGNMKLALNGALTIGTLDGANIEIKEHVGGENMFIFGLLAEEVAERRRAGLDMTATIDNSPALKEVLNAVESGMFSRTTGAAIAISSTGLRHHDYFMVTADFEAYRSAQSAVSALWQDKSEWWRIAVLNTARMSWFSADRAILDYAQEIWRAEPGLA